MSQSVLPIKIRPHLIPFFYKEFDGIEANYLGKKAKACKISMDNSLGFLIRLSVAKIHLPEKTSKLSLYISLSNDEGKKRYTAKLYKHVDGRYSFLSLPAAAARKVNDHLEDIFRIGFVFYVDGAIRHKKCKVDEAIYDFMIEYELDDYGYSVETLRKYRNRNSNKYGKISRLQGPPGNKALHFSN